MNGRKLGMLLAVGLAALACNQADPNDDDDMVAESPESDGGRAGSGGDEPDGGAVAGSGGEAGGGAGGSGAPDDLDYFPMRDGASWTYLHSSGGGWEEKVTLEAEGTPDHFLFKTSADPDGFSEEQTLVVTDGEVYRVAQEVFDEGVLDQTVEYDPGFLRFAQKWTEQDSGYTERRTYQRTETKAGSAAKEPMDRAHIYTVEALSEEITVPAGVFRNCLRMRRGRDYDTTGPDGMVLPEDQEKRYWFCPGVGKVREESITADGVMMMSFEVLTEYDL